MGSDIPLKEGVKPSRMNRQLDSRIDDEIEEMVWLD